MTAMIESIGTRLRIVLGRADPNGSTVREPAPDALPAARDLEFVAYAEDCLLSGRLQLSTGRLTDMLNEHDEYLLVDVLLERLTDGGSLEVQEVLVRRGEVLLVQATGPRGNAARRRRTLSHPVALQVGPYRVRGYLHALPGADAIQQMRRSRPMVPLTHAWIDYESGGIQQRQRVRAVVVNREEMDWIVPADDDEVEMPDLPLKARQRTLIRRSTGPSF
jgi:hypothetical protein